MRASRASKFHSTPSRHLSLVLGVHTSGTICPREDTPKEKACTGPGNRLGPSGHGITASQVPEEWSRGDSEWVHPLGPTDSLPREKAKAEGDQCEGQSRGLSGQMPYAPLTQPHQMEIRADIYPTLYKNPSDIILSVKPLYLVRLQHHAI